MFIPNGVAAIIGPENGVFMVAIFALCIPIAKLFLNHQQRMAEIIHRSARPELDEQISSLRSEVFELKQLVHEQMLTIDSLSTRQVTQTSEIQDRLELK